MSSMSYNASGVLYDSDSEAVDYNGLSYDDLLNSNFNDPTFVESYLCRYIGKGPGMERVLLIIPSVSPRVISNHDDALRLMVKVLDEHLDRKYSLVICQTCVSWTDSNSYYFVNQWYEMLPRYKKKNLVKVYLIHSLMVTKTFLTLSNPFKSSKTLDKVEVFDTLSDVLQKLELNKKNMLRNFPYVVQRAEELNLGIQRPISPFGTDLWILSARLGNKFKEFHHIPTVLSFVLQYLESKEYVITQNLLHLQLESNKLYDLVSKVEDMGENYEFLSVEEVVVVFRLILGTQRCGLFGPETHTKFTAIVVNQGTFEEAQEELRKQVKQLRSEMFECILCIIKTLRVVVRNSSRNGMNLKLVSKAMAPFFFRPMKPDVYIYKLLPMYEGLLSSMIEKPGLYFDKEPQAKLVNKEPTESTSVNTRETSRERERSKERKEKEHSRSKREDNSKDNKSREHNSRDETSRDRSREDSKDNRLREDSKERRERGSRLVEDKSPRNDSITLSD
ncbi:Divergent CRAL/TRIO domain protein [Theileria parva strain Muguga]|uniref:Divergent CRAL/TRIO domain protein n=1 Tax=Theileria parva strain Muguga TaxID=333668 RepID=UPI001C61BB67|nr:Divergent CRAL/TRIO domain protein [Theileria parva strain Muguga]KAF5153088.1 Divergent CRAL/TRIO domain protein [Theileria parva strain Muguga]